MCTFILTNIICVSIPAKISSKIFLKPLVSSIINLGASLVAVPLIYSMYVVAKDQHCFVFRFIIGALIAASGTGITNFFDSYIRFGKKEIKKNVIGIIKA